MTEFEMNYMITNKLHEDKKMSGVLENDNWHCQCIKIQKAQ